MEEIIFPVAGNWLLSASEIAPLNVVTDIVTVVATYAPAVVLVAVAKQCPPPRPAVFVLSVRSVIPTRSAFVHPEQLLVAVALRLVEVMRTTNVSATAVVAPGIVPVVSLAALSFPPAPVSHGLPEGVTPEKQWIWAVMWLPELVTTGGTSPPTVRFQKTANREAGFTAADPALCGDHVGIWTKPFAVVKVMAWFSDSTASKHISPAAIPAPYGGVMVGGTAPAPAVNRPEDRYAGAANASLVFNVSINVIRCNISGKKEEISEHAKNTITKNIAPNLKKYANFLIAFRR